VVKVARRTDKSIKHRARQLYFVLRYTYGVPEEILDKIDFLAYADPKLTFAENLQLLVRLYPALRRYVEPGTEYEAERYAEEWVSFLRDTLEGALAGDPQAIETMQLIGFDDPEEFAKALIDEGVITEEEYQEMKEGLKIPVEEMPSVEEVKPPNYDIKYITEEWLEQVREFANKASREQFAEHLAKEFGIPERYLYPEKFFKRGVEYIARDAFGYYQVVRREARGPLNPAKLNAVRTLLETYYNRFLKPQKPSIDELVEKVKERIMKTLREYYPDIVPFMSIVAVENVIREAGEYPSTDLVEKIVRRLEREGLAVREGYNLFLLRFEEDDRISGWGNRVWLRQLAMLAHLIVKNVQAGYTEPNLDTYLTALKKAYDILMKEGRRVWHMYEPLDRAILRLVQGIDVNWSELLGKQSVRELIEEAERAVRRAEVWKEAEKLKKKYEEAEKHLRKPSIKEYYDWLEKAGRLEWVQEAIRRAKEVYPDIVTDLLMWELIYRALDRRTTKEDLIRYAEEWARRVKEEAEKKRVREEKKPPAPPKPPEKPFFELARKLAFEKLQYFTKAKALELGLPIQEINRILGQMKDELWLLANGIVTGDTTQEDAEREIEEGLRTLARKREEERKRREEEERRRAEEEEKRRPRISRREALRRIRQEIEAALRREGYTGITRALRDIREDLETLAESVEAGRLTIEEAVRRGLGLVRTYATPPKPERRRRIAEGVEVPREIEVPREVRGIIEKEQELRSIGNRLVSLGERTGLGRYIWAGELLRKYAHEAALYGIYHAISQHIGEVLPWIMKFRNVYEALRQTGIRDCVAKALTGVVYDYMGVPEERWEPGVKECYDAFIEAAERPPETRGRSLWEIFG
jgi:hypothetical protein